MAARRLRPIRRWISAVRPEGFPCATSRWLRVWVARGSMAYSAVSHPSPLSFLKGGTRFSTLAATSTRVSPSEISAEPSANLRTPVSMRTGRRASRARPSGRGEGVVLMAGHSIRQQEFSRRGSSAGRTGCVFRTRRVERRPPRTLLQTRLPNPFLRRRNREDSYCLRPARRDGAVRPAARPCVQPPGGAVDHPDAQGGRHRFLHVQQL